MKPFNLAVLPRAFKVCHDWLHAKPFSKQAIKILSEDSIAIVSQSLREHEPVDFAVSNLLNTQILVGFRVAFESTSCLVAHQQYCK